MINWSGDPASQVVVDQGVRDSSFLFVGIEQEEVKESVQRFQLEIPVAIQWNP